MSTHQRIVSQNGAAVLAVAELLEALQAVVAQGGGDAAVVITTRGDSQAMVPVRNLLLAPDQGLVALVPVVPLISIFDTAAGPRKEG